MNWDPIATVTGAVIGVFGGYLLAQVNLSNDELKRTAIANEAAAQNYLLPAQDAVEALWFRLNNVQNEGGLSQGTKEYFEASSIYALGRVLMYSRSLHVDGVFVVLERSVFGFGGKLREGFRQFDDLLDTLVCRSANKACFHRYIRVGLAEALETRDKEKIRPINYLEFAADYEGKPEFKRSLAPAAEFLAQLDRERGTKLLEALRKLACDISTQTKIAPAIRESCPT